jgi:hypothetical protein
VRRLIVPAKPSDLRAASYSLFAAGIAMLILSLTLSHSLGLLAADPATQMPDFSSQLPFLLPALLGSLFAFVGGVRISRFARPWNLVLGGCALLATSWFAPNAMAALPGSRDFAWTKTRMLMLFFLRILGLIFSTTGTLRLLHGKKGARNTFF